MSEETVKDDPIAFLDKALFSRTNATGEALAELRCDMPRIILNVLDAKASFEAKQTGKRVSRTDIVNRILSKWAREQIDEASLIQQLAGLNPDVLEVLDRRVNHD